MGEFSITIYTLAQTAPGLFAVNIAILTGHKLRGTKGSVVATIASFLPPFIIVLMLCKVYEKWKEYYMFKGIKLHILEELCNLHHLLLKHAPVHEKGHSDG